jgi:dTDP-4-dehydrorhamnose reductase
MKPHLVIGGDGMVGRALRAELTRSGIAFEWTSRRGSSEADIRLDLLNLPLAWPEGEAAYAAVYIVAAVPKFADCERDPLTWLINADAPITLARLFRKSFVVFISSDVVEYAGNTAYARQKAHAEVYMQAIGNAAVVRPARIAPEHARRFASFLVAIATTRHAGLVRWKAPDVATPLETETGVVAYG